MSADNWDICPRCYDKAQAEYEERLSLVEASYGRVSMYDFDKLREDIVEPNEEDFRTFREDYEIYGAIDGKIRVRYSGYCQKCNLNLDFNHEHVFYEPKESW